MMRAVLVKDGSGPAENLYIGEVPKPQITPKQILVKVCSTTLVAARSGMAETTATRLRLLASTAWT